MLFMPWSNCFVPPSGVPHLCSDRYSNIEIRMTFSIYEYLTRNLRKASARGSYYWAAHPPPQECWTCKRPHLVWSQLNGERIVRITMQWGIIKCCRVMVCQSLYHWLCLLFVVVTECWWLRRVSGRCLSALSRVVLVHHNVCHRSYCVLHMINDFLNSSLVLYMIYYPPHLKYAEIEIDTHDARPVQHYVTPIRSDDWRLSKTLSSVVAIHLLVASFKISILLWHFCTQLSARLCDFSPPCNHQPSCPPSAHSPGFYMDDISRRFFRYPCYHSIHATNRAHLSFQIGRCPEHPNAVHAESGCIRHGIKHRIEVCYHQMFIRSQLTDMVLQTRYQLDEYVWHPCIDSHVPWSI